MNSALSAASAPELRAPEVNRRLAQEYPDARCALDYESPLQLLIATVLSAQCTDERVNSVTPELFARYPEAADYAAAQRSDLERILRPLGFQALRRGTFWALGRSWWQIFKARSRVRSRN